MHDYVILRFGWCRRFIQKRGEKVSMRKKTLLIGIGAVITMQTYLANTVEARQVTVDSQVLEQLQKLVADQQKQLDSLRNQVNQFQQTAMQAQAQAQEAKSVAEEAEISRNSCGKNRHLGRGSCRQPFPVKSTGP